MSNTEARPTEQVCINGPTLLNLIQNHSTTAPDQHACCPPHLKDTSAQASPIRPAACSCWSPGTCPSADRAP